MSRMEPQATGPRPSGVPNVSTRPAVVTAVLTAGLLLGVAGPAQASCASASPPPSQYRFTGTVLSTTNRGRAAQVRTDEGQTVEIDGSPASSGATSVDRTYNVGLRYEFHPLNSSSPFQDNACTATRVLQNSKQEGPPPTEGRTNSVADADVPNGHTKLWTSVAVGGLAAVSLVAVALARRSRKSGAS